MRPSGATDPSDLRNMAIFVAIVMVIMFAWEFFYAKPVRERADAERAVIEETLKAQEAASPTPEVEELLPRSVALEQSADERVAIAPAHAGGATIGAVDGSILLRGARFDDLRLREHHETIARDSAEVTLLSPRDAEHGFDAFLGWQDHNPAFFGVGEDDVWRAQDGAQLTPTTPLVLTYESGDGLEITRTISLDEHYMFTITDAVKNVAQEAREVRPFGVVRRDGLATDYRQNGIVHQGFIGAFGPKLLLQQVNYEKAIKHAKKKTKGETGQDARIVELQGQGGWLGVTDHYWLAAIALDGETQASSFYDAREREGGVDFRAAYTGEWRAIAPGETLTYTQRMFAGAKDVDLLRTYEKQYSLSKFDSAVDWGNFWFLTRPLFALLDYLGDMIGNFGVAILISTVVIRTITFPLVYQSFKMSAKMRAIAPKMKEIQERFAADKPRQQQEVLKLYQAEKVNPVSGCVPMLLQFPVFFALYKTLTVTIEMRHAPFFGWIQDLSARDPTTLFNLFGLLPFDPTSLPIVGSFLWIGVWPLVYGASMWVTQAMSPPPTDPIQAQIFRLLPLLFTFMFASFAAGLVIYYTWSNVITAIQQYFIMRHQGVETQFDGFIAKYLRKTKPETASAE